MNQKPQLTKSIKISSVGPFNEDGIQINFGVKQNPDKANIHILVGENGCGKSTVLKEVFADCLGVKSLIKTIKLNPVPYFDPSSRIKNQEYPTFFYTPSETPEEILYKLYQQTVISLRSKSEWVYSYPENDYLEFIKDLENNRNQLLADDNPSITEDRKLTIEQKNRIKIDTLLTEKLELFIKNIYNIKFLYKRDSKLQWKPFINGSLFEFSQLSTGYRQIISLITDILIKVWSIESDLEDKSQGQFVLLLDEIDVHLHPKAQRRILPALQSMFPNSEIFCTTHSPFVVNSVDDAWVYELSEENYQVNNNNKDENYKILTGLPTSTGNSYYKILSRDFNETNRFGLATEELLKELSSYISGGKPIDNNFYDNIVKQLIAKDTTEINQILRYELSKLESVDTNKLEKLWQK